MVERSLGVGETPGSIPGSPMLYKTDPRNGNGFWGRNLRKSTKNGSKDFFGAGAGKIYVV